MEDEDLGYPLGDEDLKRRVAGEVLRTFEQQGSMPPVAEVVEVVEAVIHRVSDLVKEKDIPFRRIDLTTEVQNYLQTRNADPGNSGSTS